MGETFDVIGYSFSGGSYTQWRKFGIASKASARRFAKELLKDSHVWEVHVNGDGGYIERLYARDGR